MGANKNHKASVFSFLFSDPDILRELYCALGGVTLPPDVPVKINTLEDVLFMNMLNDISFEIGGKLVVLVEHQSTINNNMALRFLMYIARVYEKLVGDKNIYSYRQIKIPRPEFFVLYNGKAELKKGDEIVRLSGAFGDGSSLELNGNEPPALDLTAKVVDINQGRNKEIERKCKTLAGYSAFVAKVREYRNRGESGEESLKKAVRYCRDHDILKEFLETNATEVLNMLYAEWNMDDALAVRFEEGKEEGFEEGREKGLEYAREKIALKALAQGFSIEVIQSLTDLDRETIQRLAEEN